MAQQLTPIKNINKSTKNWTTKVKVLEKWRPRTAQHSPLKFQKLILANEEGSKVQATIFDENIQKLEGTLEVYNTYLISNAEVKFVPPQFRKIDFEWQWQINARTLIQTFDESFSHQDFLNLDFIPFEQFEQHFGEQTAIDNSHSIIDELVDEAQLLELICCSLFNSPLAFKLQVIVPS